MFVWIWGMVAVVRLDQILGKQGSSSKGKDIYDNKYCLASRIVNVERQVALMTHFSIHPPIYNHLYFYDYLLLFYNHAFFFQFKMFKKHLKNRKNKKNKNRWVILRSRCKESWNCAWRTDSQRRTVMNPVEALAKPMYHRRSLFHYQESRLPYRGRILLRPWVWLAHHRCRIH